MMKKVIVKVENLKCHGCASTITKGLLKFKEVETVNVDVENSIVQIIFEGEEANVERYKKKLSSLGYPEDGNNDAISVVKSYVSCAVGRMNN